MEPLLEEEWKVFRSGGSPCAAGTIGTQGATGAEGRLQHTIPVFLGRDLHTSTSGID